MQCRMQLRLSMDIKALRGPLVVWVPPPPGDRLWFSFLEPPQLQITASPLVSLRLHISGPPSGSPEGSIPRCTLSLFLCMPISCRQPNVVSVSCMQLAICCNCQDVHCHTLPSRKQHHAASCYCIHTATNIWRTAETRVYTKESVSTKSWYRCWFHKRVAANSKTQALGCLSKEWRRLCSQYSVSLLLSAGQHETLIVSDLCSFHSYNVDEHRWLAAW